MPSLQVVDLNPNPRTETTSLEKTLSSFAKRNRENQIEQQDSDALSDIYNQYKQGGENIDQLMWDIQSKPGISPTRRVSAAAQAVKMKESNDAGLKDAKKAHEDAKKAENNKAILQDIENKRNLAPGSLSAYEGDPKMAEQVTRPIKAPTKTQASQPIDEGQLQRIQHVEAKPEFINGTIPEKKKLLRDAGVSKENSDSVVDAFVEEQKIPGERASVIAKKQAENDVAFVEEQASKYPSLVAREQTVAAADVLNEEGVTGLIWDQAMQKAGLLQFNEDGYRLFASYAKEMVKNQNIKSVIGSQISQMEFGFFRDATISERFSKEANRQILKKEKLAIRYDKLYADITKAAIEKNKGDIPERIQSKVNEEFGIQSQKISKELRETAIDFDAIQNVPEGKVLMYDKKRRPIHVPANEVEKYSKPPFGASLS